MKDIPTETLLENLAQERSKFTQSNQELMQSIVDELMDRRVYPRVSGINYAPMKMVECWGAYWHTYRGPLNCPSCKADWRNLEQGPPFKREIGISNRDRVIAWKCPECRFEIKVD